MTPTQRRAMEQALEWIEAQREPRMIGATKTTAALRAALAEQPAEQEPMAWIPKAKQMPPPGQRVFWMDTDTNMVGYDTWAGEDFLWMPTHWMPIPALNESAAEATQPASPSCLWHQDDDTSNTWASACGELWSFIDGGPADNRVRHCHGCGRPVTVQESPQ